MTGSQLLDSDDVGEVFDALSARFPPSERGARFDRKARLLACAGTNAAWSVTPGPARNMVRLAERMADGRAPSDEEMNCRGWRYDGNVRACNLASIEAMACLDEHAWAGACLTFSPTEFRSPGLDAATVRDIFGNVFRQCGREDEGKGAYGPLVDWEWGGVDTLEFALHGRPGSLVVRRSWLSDDALSLALGAYEERLEDGRLDDFRLLLLADALEESGCDCEELLRHLRGHEPVPNRLRETPTPLTWRPLRSPHFRGCWVLDLILGK